MKVRCKFTCEVIGQDRNGCTASFIPVTDGSKENDKFFKWTPGGKLDLSTIKKQHFKPGKEYYIDISLASNEESEVTE